MKKKVLLFACLAAFGLSMAVTGCSKEEPAKKSEIQEEKKEEKLEVIGVEKDSEFQVKLTNSTAKNITGVSVKSSDEAEYPANMLKESDVFEDKESRLLCYTAPKAAEAPADAKATDKVLEPAYDIQLTFEDGTTAVLHSFPFGDVEEGEICMEDVVYLKYTSVASKEKVDTKGAEQAVKAQAEAEAAAKAAAEAQAAAEAAAAEQAAAEAAAAEQAAAEAAAQQTYTEEYYYEEPSYDAGYDNGAAGGDACLDGGLTY